MSSVQMAISERVNAMLSGFKSGHATEAGNHMLARAWRKHALRRMKKSRHFARLARAEAASLDGVVPVVGAWVFGK